MKRLHITATLLFWALFVCHAQQNVSDLFGGQGGSRRDVTTDRQRQERIRDIKSIGENQYSTKEEAIAKDYVLYRDVVRRYTWLEGLGEPITQQTANHLPYYFRLSQKNQAGHFQVVEAMHGNALTTKHPLSTYILDKNTDASEQNKQWCERLQSVNKWILLADISGDIIVEERAYATEKDQSKLVYTMQPSRADSRHVTITYTDSWGYPADMNENEQYTYGSVVYITYDQHGCDSIIDYLDGAGYRKPNTNNMDQIQCIYDSQYRPILKTSNNCVGDYAIDNWGNCGVRYVYNDKENSYSIINVDEKLEPMRLPEIRAGVAGTYIRCDIKKDNWGRRAEAIMLTADGAKDITTDGVHRITYTYTNDGNLKKVTYYNIDDKEIIIK